MNILHRILGLRDFRSMTRTGQRHNAATVSPDPSLTPMPTEYPGKHPYARVEDMPLEPIFFVFGCARSGTTSLCEALDFATNAVCLTEPAPNLTYETREMMDGRCADPFGVISRTLAPRIHSVLDQGLIYGEKNNTLGPFVPYLARHFAAKFVLVVRDGRDVTRSLMNWHNQMFGTVYRECKEMGELSERAQQMAGGLSVENDWSDYSRPRPSVGDPWHERWLDLSRFEMCAWYWAYINRLFLNNLEQIQADRWMCIDYTRPSPESVVKIAEFLGLTGVDRTKVQLHLDSKVNSLEQRTGESGRFPAWDCWDTDRTAQFEVIAASVMREFGYL